MKICTRNIPWLTFVIAAGAIWAEPVQDANTPAQSMIETYLKNEAKRLDEQLLEGITNREEWDARRVELRQEYLEMLGLWPLPERTPLLPKVTGVIERDGFEELDAATELGRL